MWRSLREATQKDIDAVIAGYHENAAELTDHLIAQLELLKGEKGGFTIDRYDHCLQTATRAHRDGKDEEYVVCALLHDIGDTLAPHNHGELIATFMRPFVSEANYWMLEHHTTFQGYYFWDKIGQDPNARDKYKDQPYYEYTIEFCDKYDSTAFDPDYQSEPIEFFKPMVHNVVKSPKTKDF
ncbi:MAG: HD domain-containing protein [Mycobacterium sp.]|nr:HD domain-containing protein [Mycobacterium sp.]